MRLQDVSMKGLGAGLLGAGLLGLLLGSPVNVKAQDTRDDAKPPQEQPKQEEAKPAAPQAAPKDMKPPQEQPPAKADEAKPMKNEKPNDDMKMGKQDQPQAHAKPAAQQGKKIPDAKFHSNFGRQHTFQVQKTVIVEGQPRFQYSGYWFTLSDPWPVGWAYADDCYIDFIDGEYVLIDLLHPGVQIVLVVVD
jgi:hypothetical protein